MSAVSKFADTNPKIHPYRLGIRRGTGAAIS